MSPTTTSRARPGPSPAPRSAPSPPTTSTSSSSSRPPAPPTRPSTAGEPNTSATDTHGIAWEHMFDLAVELGYGGAKCGGADCSADGARESAARVARAGRCQPYGCGLGD